MDDISSVTSTSIKSDFPGNTAVAVVHITKPDEVDAVAISLPAQPVVVSLQYYDTVAEHMRKDVNPGYPLVCVSPCDSRYPNYLSLKILCSEIGLGTLSRGDSFVNFMWEIAIPSENGDMSHFQPILDSTIFAGSDHEVLDSMFIAPNFSVRCVATLVDQNGLSGPPLRSDVVRVASDAKGICPRKPNRGDTINAPYLRKHDVAAKLFYINDTDEDHPNTVQIDLKIPHEDGMVPLVSTLPIHNIRYLLTEKLFRTHHACSNLHVDRAFMESSPVDEQRPRPHQWDTTLRQVSVDIETMYFTYQFSEK